MIGRIFNNALARHIKPAVDSIKSGKSVIDYGSFIFRLPDGSTIEGSYQAQYSKGNDIETKVFREINLWNEFRDKGVADLGPAAFEDVQFDVTSDLQRYDGQWQLSYWHGFYLYGFRIFGYRWVYSDIGRTIRQQLDKPSLSIIPKDKIDPRKLDIRWASYVKPSTLNRVCVRNDLIGYAFLFHDFTSDDPSALSYLVCPLPMGSWDSFVDGECYFDGYYHIDNLIDLI